MKRTAIFALVCATLAVGLFIWGFSSEDGAKPATQISGALLMVEDDTGAYLMQLRKGLQEAVQERGGALSVERLADIETSLSRPSYENYSAIYLLSDRPDAYLPALHDMGLPVIVLGKEVRGETCVLPDEEGGGQLLGEHIASLVPGGHLLVIGSEQEARDTLRLKGVTEGLGGLSYTLLSPEALETARIAEPDAILALSDSALETALGLRGQNGPPVFSFDAADTRLELMEAGELAGIAADDPYALGYIAGSLLDSIRDNELSPFIRLSPRRLVTRDTMYDAANVKLMFPLLH